MLQVMDSQCAGSVVPDESTYLVDWVSRPFARLSSETESTYEYFNGSHILPPICEDVNDHVDLDLAGEFIRCSFIVSKCYKLLQAGRRSKLCIMSLETMVLVVSSCWINQFSIAFSHAPGFNCIPMKQDESITRSSKLETRLIL